MRLSQVSAPRVPNRRRFSAICLSLGLGAVLFAAAPASAASSFVEVNELIAVQGSSTIGLNQFGYTNTANGQTFLVPTTAVLNTVTVGVFCNNAFAPQPLIMDFCTAKGDGTPGTLLGTEDIQPASVPSSGGNVTVDFSSHGIGLIGGDEYAFTLRVATPGSDVNGNTPYSAFLNASGSYTAGNRLLATDGVSFFNSGTAYSDIFQVTAVPEPGSIGLLALSGTTLLSRRRKA